MIWGGIFLTARTELFIVDGGRLTSQRYIADILETFVVPFPPYIGNGFLLMQDNTRPHATYINTEYLNKVNIQVLRWPA